MLLAAQVYNKTIL